MGKYLKIPSINNIPDSDVVFQDLYAYNTDFYEMPEAYPSLLKVDEDGKHYISLDSKTSLFFLDEDADGNRHFLPSIFTISMNILLHDNILFYDSESPFGVFGIGSDNRYDNYGLYVNNQKFVLLVGNRRLRFNKLVFGGDLLPYNKLLNLTLTVNTFNDSAKIYVNGKVEDEISLVDVIFPDLSAKKIYIGQLGRISNYKRLLGNLYEIGMWQRELTQAQIDDIVKFGGVVNTPEILEGKKKIKIDAGKLYFEGLVHNIPDSYVYLTETGDESIDLYIKEIVVTENEDPELLDNSGDYFNFGKPGMHRLKYAYEIGINLPEIEGATKVVLARYRNGTKIYDIITNVENDLAVTDDINGQPVYVVNESNVNVSLLTLENKMNSAVYDMAGNFIVQGMLFTYSQDDDYYYINMSPGSYYLNGMKYSFGMSTMIPPIEKKYQSIFIENEFFKYDTTKLYKFSEQPVSKDNPPKINAPVISRSELVSRGMYNSTNPLSNFDIILNSNTIRLLRVAYGGNVIFYDGMESNAPCRLVGNRIYWDQIPGIPQGATYEIDYVYSKTLAEKIDYHVILGDVIEDIVVDDITQSDITITTDHKPEYIVYAKIGNVTFSNEDFYVEGFTIYFKNPSIYFPIGSKLQLKYSYSSTNYTQDKWHIYIEPTTNEISSEDYAYINYYKLLQSVYTLFINSQNKIELHEGYSTEAGDNPLISTTKKNILPLVDIYLTPPTYKSQGIRLRSYEKYRVSVSELRDLMVRMTNLENNLAIQKLEWQAKSSEDERLLVGTYIDSMADYTYSDIYDYDYDNFIKFTDGYYSGSIGNFNNYIFRLSPNTNTETLYQIIEGNINYRTTNTIYDNTAITKGQLININDSRGNSHPEVIVYNDFNYITEDVEKWSGLIMNSALYSDIPIIPDEIGKNAFMVSDAVNNSDFAVVNEKELLMPEGSRNTTGQALSTFAKILDQADFRNLSRNKKIIIWGRGFNPKESGIEIFYENQKLSLNKVSILPPIYNIIPYAIVSTEGTYYDTNYMFTVENYFPNGDNPYIENNEMEEATKNQIVYMHPDQVDGQNCIVDASNMITATSDGEFLVSIDAQDYLENTGLYTFTIKRYNNFETKFNVNCTGVYDKIKSIIVNGERTVDNAFGYNKGTVNNEVTLCQIIKADQSLLVDGISFYLKNQANIVNDITVEIREIENNAPTSRILASGKVTSSQKPETSFIKGSDRYYKVTANFRFPPILNEGSNYGICFITNDNKYEIGLAKIGETNHTGSLITTTSKINAGVVMMSYGLTQHLLDTEIAYQIHACDISYARTNADGWYYQEIIFEEKQVPLKNNLYTFGMMCDCINANNGDTKVEWFYRARLVEINDEKASIYSTNVGKWYRFYPYSKVKFNKKILSIQVKCKLISRTKNVSPKVHLYPTLILFEHKQRSSYVSRTFENYEDVICKSASMYLDAHIPDNCYFSTFVRFNHSNVWNRVDRYRMFYKSVGTFNRYKYMFDMRLGKPIILESSVKANGSLSKTKYGKYIWYVVSVLDQKTYAEINEVSAGECYSKIFKVEIPDGEVFNKFDVQLKINVDSNFAGFKVYRGLQYGTDMEYAPDMYEQIYDSTANGYIKVPLSGVSGGGDGVYGLVTLTDVNIANNFPNSGKLKIDNEVMRYNKRDGNLFYIQDRGVDNTVISKHNVVSRALLWDYNHEGNFNGQIPHLDTNAVFYFTDNAQLTTLGREIYINDEMPNSTELNPKLIKIRIELRNYNMLNTAMFRNLVFNMISENILGLVGTDNVLFKSLRTFDGTGIDNDEFADIVDGNEDLSDLIRVALNIQVNGSFFIEYDPIISSLGDIKDSTWSWNLQDRNNPRIVYPNFDPLIGFGFKVTTNGGDVIASSVDAGDAGDYEEDPNRG